MIIDKKMLSEEQRYILNELKKEIVIHYKNKEYFFIRKIVGYAGTGKTTLISFIKKEIEKIDHGLTIAFLSLTGKAASVMKYKLLKNNIVSDNDIISTIHSCIYSVKTYYDKIKKMRIIVGWELKSYLECDYIIIDEGSLISHELWKDLLSFKKPIIVFGDNKQLPPVKNDFNLFKIYDYKMKTVLRHQEDSPIIKLATFIRKNGYLPKIKNNNNSVYCFQWNDKFINDFFIKKVDFNKNDNITLCAFNITRVNINYFIRENVFYYKDDEPIPGEKIVCLKNNHDIKIMNGEIGKILFLMPTRYKSLARATISINDDIYELIIDKETFGKVKYKNMYFNDKNMEINDIQKEMMNYVDSEGFYQIDHFDFGYCISVHKSQGSEWNNVILFNQYMNKWSDDYYMRWLYTGVTRAKSKLIIINDYY